MTGRPKDRLKNPRARLFVALDLPEAAGVTLSTWQRELCAAAGRDLRPLRADALHVTLAFIGYRAERDVEAIAAGVSAVLGGGGATLEFRSEIAPRPTRRPKLYAAPLAPLDDLMDLRAAVARELSNRKLFKDERREFWPHVTLCRVKSSARDHRAPAELPPAPAPLTRGQFAAGAVTLYRSHLEPAGARYEALARFALPGEVSAPD
ncbi:MAG: RNA 2',3'-cyclic phosphodiesterase [Actinobacteria bacterium]|nr:RNA 2',3'-cyclic phosphodiesterase [Actinomycetota bacterium]